MIRGRKASYLIFSPANSTFGSNDRGFFSFYQDTRHASHIQVLERSCAQGVYSPRKAIPFNLHFEARLGAGDIETSRIYLALWLPRTSGSCKSRSWSERAKGWGAHVDLRASRERGFESHTAENWWLRVGLWGVLSGNV